MTEKTYYPFKLLITVLEAQNLPIADYTTSDPFIIAYLGDRQIGRTKVIYRNHWNPKWNETLPHIGLLHTNYELEFKVYDEDVGKDNDYLGNIKIDLKDIPSNGKEIRKRYDMVNAPGYKSKSTVDILILLARNDRVISIQTIDPHANQPEYLAQKIQQDFLSQPVFENLQKERIWQETQSEMIKSTVQKLLTEENVSSTVFSVPFLRDLLVEASVFEPPTSEIVPKDYIIDIIRNKVKLQNSTKLILQEGTCYQHAPIEDCSLQINLTADDTRFVLLTFSNRFMIWSWIKWIRLAYDFWHGNLTKADLPDWASSLVRYSNGFIFLSDGRQQSHRKIILDLTNPFVLKFGDGESVSLRTMCSLISSADSFTPSQYLLELQIHEKSLIGFQQDGIEGLNVNYAVKTTPTRKGRMSVVGAVGGAITTMKTLTHRGRTLVKETAIGGLTNTVNAVRIISTGDPTKVIKGAQDKILGVTGTVMNTVTSVPQTFFGKSMSFVKIRCRNEIFQFPLPINLIEMHQLDFDFDDLYKKSHSTMQRARMGSQDQSVSLYRLYPPRKTFGLSMDVTLFHGVEGLPKVFGQSLVKVRNIINTGKGGNASPPPGAERKYSELDILYGEPGEFDVPLTKKIGYSVTLLHANNLILPSVGLAAANAIMNRTVYAKCKLVNGEGRGAFKGIHHDDDQYSPQVKATANPVWNHSFPPLLTGDAIDNELFVRVEFFVEDLTNLRGTSIGGCFIPLDYFNVTEHEYTFSLGRFRASSSTVVPLAVGSNKGYGEVTLRLRKIAEDFDHHLDGKKYRLFLQTIVKEASLFNTSWYGEILPVSGIDAENTCVERALVTILHDGLQLNEQESMTLTDNKSDQSLSVVYDRPTEAWSRADQIFSLTTREFIIEVFENERRAPYPPFDWSNSAYTRAHYSDFAFKKSFKFENLKDAAPPDGCDWANEWSVDKSHAKTDEEGWFYGFTFGLIISNYTKGITYSAPSNCHARRRKWFRKAKLREDEHLEASQVLNSFGNSLSKLTKHTSGRKVSLSSSMHSDISSHDEWRKSLSKNRQQGILSTCKEKLSEESPIVVDWSEISSATVITPSILSITFRVHRYFPDTQAFREVEVEMFCSNCPATEFQSLIKERIWFHRIRCSIKQLVSSGNIYGSTDALSGTTSVTTTTALLQDTDNSVLSVEEIPQTEELSLGSDTIKELDDQLINLQNQVNEMSQTLRISHDKNLHAERTILERRIIRLQLYISGLFGLSLQGVHGYDEEEIRKLMFIDFQRAKGINLSDDVSTANNRIEFLLDMAEMRIRDAALCGWKYRGGQLENCLQILANGYFIEIVSILGKFFERESDEDAEAQTKGLTSKIELVNTYMKHNDRLHLLISNALRPYGLMASPPAQLSLFLDFNVLVKWYTSTLITEMRSWVNKVLITWKDVTKDVTGNAGSYKFPLPWIPERHSSGRFYSNIPEDLVAALLNYLNYARMNSETVAPHFHSYLGQMDIKVCLAYTNSFLLLSEGYLSGLKMKEWYKLADEGELSEYCAWVASVMNDARRVVEKKILNLSQFKAELKLPQNEDTEISVEQAISAYQRVESVSIDQMSCLFFIFIFYGQEDILSVGLAEVWKRTKHLGPQSNPSSGDLSASGKKHSPTDSSAANDFSFTSFFESLQFYLENYQDFFNPISYQILVHIVLMKALVMYFSLLQHLAYNGEIFEPTHPVIEALLADSVIVIEKIRSYLPSLSATKGLIDERVPGVKLSRVMVELSQEMIHGSLFLLEKLPVLLRESIQSPLFYQVINELKDFGQKTYSSELCTALASALEIILSLRGVARYYSSQQHQTLKARRGSSAAVHRNSNVTPSKATAAVSSAAVTHEKDHNSGGPKKRTSILNYFYGGGGHHPEAPHSPVPPPAPSPDESKRRNSRVDTSSIDGADETNDFLAEMEHEREQSVIACFDLIFQELRDYNPEKDSSITPEQYLLSERKKVKSLAFVHPLVRVFHQSQVKFSLMHDLVLSAVPGKSRDAAAVKKKEVLAGTPGTPTPKASDGKKKMTMNFNFVTGLFTRGGGPDTDHLSTKMKAISSLDEDDYEGSSTNNLSTTVEGSTSATAGEGSTIRTLTNTSEIPFYKAIDGEPFIIITFYELKLFNLFFVDMFGQPKPYFVLHYRDFLTRSRAKVMTTEMETCWSDETPIQVPIYEVTSSTIEIVVQVYYEGYLNDHCIGQVVLAFSPYDLPAHKGKKFEITFNPHSKKVQQALTKTKTEGRDLLSLSLSTNASKCKRQEENL